MGHARRNVQNIRFHKGFHTKGHKKSRRASRAGNPSELLVLVRESSPKSRTADREKSSFTNRQIVKIAEMDINMQDKKIRTVLL